ncbi:MAG: DNA primase [Candidatus Fermentibacteraceae bacterium]|nr:DNA primase [Candidatus Fermentibacteraceae bacterium]
MSYDGSEVELVKNSTDIVSVIQQYVELKRAGNSWKGLCPFHKEKTPSFIVFPATGTYKCFGCGAGGDVFSFLMAEKNLEFPEVLEELAEAAGITLKKGSGGGRVSAGLSKGLFEVVAEAQEFFRKCFAGTDGNTARDYLKSRDIDPEETGIGIGYAPGGNALLKHLRRLNYSVSVIGDAGLVITDRGEPYDRFRERLTFPIHDRRGRVVSFGARSMGDAVPKYLNGPETVIYRKGSFLYGYSSAQEKARQSKIAILVEGYFDHARLVSVGFSETVATSGTALTEKQARNLMGMAEKHYICYDGDSAGRKAAVKAAEILLAQGAYPLVVRLPDGMDPDDFVKNRGREAFEELLRSAYDPVSFCVSLIDGKLTEGPDRIRLAERLLEVAVSSSNPLVEEELQKKVEESTGYSREALTKKSNEIRSFEEHTRYVRNKAGNIGSGDIIVLKVATAGGVYNTDFLDFLMAGDLTTELAVRLLSVFRGQIARGFSSVVPGELPEDLSALCADIAGALQDVTPQEIQKLKKDIIRKRRELPRLRELQEDLAGSDPERKAIALEEFADMRVEDER